MIMTDQKTQEEKYEELEGKRKEFDAIEPTRGTIIIKFTDEGNYSQIDLKGVTPSQALLPLREIMMTLLEKFLFED